MHNSVLHHRLRLTCFNFLTNVRHNCLGEHEQLTSWKISPTMLSFARLIMPFLPFALALLIFLVVLAAAVRNDCSDCITIALR